MAKKKKIIKVTYFDELSAIDYLDIYRGGLYNQVKEKKSGQSGEVGAEAEIKAKTGILFKVLEPFMSVRAEGNIHGDFAHVGERVLKTTISNTVLSDYIKTANRDKIVEKINDYTVSAYENSVSFMKMYTPLLNMFDLKTNGVDFSKFDETLELIKGYFELLAENQEGDKKILRFNHKAFRNNYNLIDLTKMKLTFYAIKVGEMQIEQLNAKNEFDLKKEKEIVTRESITGDGTDNIENSIIPFYDVVLAGILSDG